jgi:hypothetical protein
MRVLTADEIADCLDHVVHLGTQRTDHGVDLTASEVFRLTAPGSLDFGGSEYEEAARERMVPKRRQADDDYGWWDLKAGTYLVRYNETVDPGDGIALVQSHERLLKAGAYHAAFRVHEAQDPLETLLVVSERGCHLKENCRISRLTIFAV